MLSYEGERRGIAQAQSAQHRHVNYLRNVPAVTVGAVREWRWLVALLTVSICILAMSATATAAVEPVTPGTLTASNCQVTETSFSFDLTGAGFAPDTIAQIFVNNFTFIQLTPASDANGSFSVTVVSPTVTPEGETVTWSFPVEVQVASPPTVVMVVVDSNCSTGPTTKEACKEGGWEALGFANQGECVSSQRSSSSG
jgi:hypothetical protein